MPALRGRERELDVERFPALCAALQCGLKERTAGKIEELHRPAHVQPFVFWSFADPVGFGGHADAICLHVQFPAANLRCFFHLAEQGFVLFQGLFCPPLPDVSPDALH